MFAFFKKNYVANMLAYQHPWEEINGTGVLGPFYL